MHIFTYQTLIYFMTTPSEEQPINFINDELVQSIVSDVNMTVESKTNEAIISQETSLGFIKELASQKGLNLKTAFTATALICQKGGTAKRASGDISAVVNGKKVTLADLRNVIRSRNWNFTIRQFARANATFIHTISEHYSIPGDLAKKIMRNRENITINDSYWLSNFQMDNPSCPFELRDLLVQHYEQTFPDAGKTVKS
jgi:hypothetical protein